MTATDTLRFHGVVERKHASLPRFVVVPAPLVGPWELAETTMVEVTLARTAVGRRSLKPWGPDREAWFFELTAAQCARAGVDTGDRVAVELRAASGEPPRELLDLIDSDASAKRNWDALSPSRRRMLAEHVRSAKRPETRRRRAAQSLTGER